MEKILSVVDFQAVEKTLVTLNTLPGYPVFKQLGAEYRGEEFGCLNVHDTECLGFIRECLELEPTRRPSAKQALQHPWFQVERDFDPELSNLFF